MDKISIILPVYNAERFVSKTIESIIDQSYQDWELIIIDDCSKDDSLSVCQRYAQKDERIKLIASEVNLGSAEARNRGLEQASGSYIAFVDSDDYVEKDYLSKMYSVAIDYKADVVWCNYNEICDGLLQKRKHGQQCLVPLDTKHIISCFLKGVDGISCLWNKLYSRKFIKDYKIHFDKRMAIGEDAFFNMLLFDKVNNTVFIEDHLYNYVKQNSNSVMATYKPNYYELYKVRHSFLLYLAEKYNVKYDYRASAQGLYVTAINFLWLLSKQESNNPLLKFKKVLDDEMFKLNFKLLRFFRLTFPYSFIYLMLRLHLYKLLYFLLKMK